MINSLFMLGSSYNKNKKISVLFMIGWIIYMLIGYINYPLGIFPIINSIVFLSMCIVINLIKNRKVNTILSVFSILIWSVVIDIICYFLYPIMNGTHNIFSYISQGILFNYKYVFVNVVAIGIINVLDYGIKHIELDSKVKIKI